MDQYQRRRKWRSWSVEEVSAFLLANELPEEVARKFERELLFSARMNSEQSVSPCKKARACDPFGGGLTTGRLGSHDFSHLLLGAKGGDVYYLICDYIGHQIAGRHLQDLTEEDLEKMEIL